MAFLLRGAHALRKPVTTDRLSSVYLETLSNLTAELYVAPGRLTHSYIEQRDSQNEAA